MIVKMKKATIFVLETHQSEALKDLRKLGVVHLNIKKGESQDIAQLKEDYGLIENAHKILDQENDSSEHIKENIDQSMSVKKIAQEIIDL